MANEKFKMVLLADAKNETRRTVIEAFNNQSPTSGASRFTQRNAQKLNINPYIQSRNQEKLKESRIGTVTSDIAFNPLTLATTEAATEVGSFCSKV